MTPGQADVAGHISAHIGGWDNPAVERAIFGTADPQGIVSAVDAFCRRWLGSPIEGSLFYRSSVGSVLGLRLTDGRRVVLKAHQPGVPVAFLEAVATVTAALKAEDFPCPAPLAGPLPLGAGTGTVESYEAEGDFRNPHEPEVCRAIARALADLSRLAAPFVDTPGLEHHGGDLPAGVLWPVPHSVLFDFEATAAGAEWIDAIARRALGMLAGQTGRRTLGHSDWAAKHFRFAGDAITVIYDWDSLRLDLEPVHVGRAAHAFTAVYDTPWAGRVAHAPTWDEVTCFVAAYESARGEPFTPGERRTLGAACAYSLAYSSRCSHALDPRPGRATGFPPGTWQDALDRFGERLLAL